MTAPDPDDAAARGERAEDAIRDLAHFIAPHRGMAYQHVAEFADAILASQRAVAAELRGEMEQHVLRIEENARRNKAELRAEMDKRLSVVDTAILRMCEDLKADSDLWHEHEERLSALEDRLGKGYATVEKRLEAHYDAIEEHRARIEELEKCVAEFKEQLSLAESRIRNLTCGIRLSGTEWCQLPTGHATPHPSPAAPPVPAAREARYVVRTYGGADSGYDVWDRKEERCLAHCNQGEGGEQNCADAERIAAALNGARDAREPWNDIDVVTRQLRATRERAERAESRLAAAEALLRRWCAVKDINDSFGLFTHTKSHLAGAADAGQRLSPEEMNLSDDDKAKLSGYYASIGRPLDTEPAPGRQTDSAALALVRERLAAWDAYPVSAKEHLDQYDWVRESITSMRALAGAGGGA